LSPALQNFVCNVWRESRHASRNFAIFLAFAKLLPE